MSAAPNHNQAWRCPFSFWDRAYDVLRRNNGQLVGEFEMLLSSDLQRPGFVGSAFPTTQGMPAGASEICEAACSQLHKDQLKVVIERRLQQLLDTKMQCKNARHGFVLKEPIRQIPQAAQLALWAKSWIRTGVDYWPEAQVIWAGICFTLPLLTIPGIADEANRNGFTYVAGRMHYFATLEMLLLKLANEAGFGPDVLVRAYREIISLYRYILQFIIQSIVRFHYTTMGIVTDDKFRSTAWKEMLDNITELESALVKELCQIPASMSGIKQDLAYSDLRWMEVRYEKEIESFKYMQRLLSDDNAYIRAVEGQPQDHKESTRNSSPGEGKHCQHADRTIGRDRTQFMNDSGTLCLHESRDTGTQPLLSPLKCNAAKFKGHWAASIPHDDLSHLLSKAIKAGQKADVMLLLDRGANVEGIDDTNGQSPLFLAAAEGQLGIVTLLVERGAQIRKENNAGLTLLACAVEAGHEAVVRFLLDKGADIETEDYEPLFCAAENGQGAVVNLLLSRGANINSRGSQGQTPLIGAIKYGEEAVVRLLLSKGADLEMSSRWGQTPLLWAAKRGERGCAKVLIERGADPSVKDRSGSSALLLAARNTPYGPTWRLLYHATHLAKVDLSS